MNTGHAVLPGNRTKRPVETMMGRTKGVSSDTFNWTDLQAASRQGSLVIRGNTTSGVPLGPGWVAWSLLGRVVR